MGVTSQYSMGKRGFIVKEQVGVTVREEMAKRKPKVRGDSG